MKHYVHQVGSVLQAGFLKAMKMVGAEFLDKVLYYKKSWLPARELVEEAVKGRTEVNNSQFVFIDDYMICIKTALPCEKMQSLFF